MAIESRYVSTSKASKILGVSTTLVKTLVDEHKLKAWKTQGGHRRIALDSIEAYIYGFQSQGQLGQPHDSQGTEPRVAPLRRSLVSPGVASLTTPQITVAVQTPQLLSSIRACLDRVVHSDALSLPRLVDSPLQALREIACDRPNVLVLEMSGAKTEQESALSLLDATQADGPPVSVLVVTRYADLKLPTPRSKRCCVHVFSGPVSLEWSRGCMVGMLTLLTALQWDMPEALLAQRNAPPQYAAVA